MVLKDIRAGIRASILLYEQEWNGYLEKIFKKQESGYKFELQLNEKTLVQKRAELEKMEKQMKNVLNDKENIEIDALREGFKNVLKAKFFNEWRSMKTKMLKLKNSTNNIKSVRKQKINEMAEENKLDSLILSSFKEVRTRIQNEWEEEQKAAGIEIEKESPANPGKRGNKPKRRLTHASSINLLYATKRGKDE